MIEQGDVTSARNLPDWEGTFPLGPTLEGELGCPVVLGNDVQVATDAEFKLGAGRLYDSLLGVFWGTGVGGGLILDGRPWIGRGGAGEIGHMVVEIDGARCTCGRRGCMEAYAGRAAMEAHARQLHEEKGRKTDLFKLMQEHERTRLTSGIWSRALEHGDKLATHVIDRALRALGAGIASAVNVLDVEGVIIGGGLGVRLGHPYAKRIAAAMQPHLFADQRPPHVHVAALGDLGGAIGAALLLDAAGAWRRRDGRAARGAPLEPEHGDHDERERQARGDGHGDAGGAVENATAALLAHHVRRAREAPDEEQVDRQQQPVDDLHADQQRDHGHAGDHRDERAEHDHRGDDVHEHGRLLAAAADALLVAERLGDDVGGRDRQDRRGQQAGAEQADRRTAPRRSGRRTGSARAPRRRPRRFRGCRA